MDDNDVSSDFGEAEGRYRARVIQAESDGKAHVIDIDAPEKKSDAPEVEDAVHYDAGKSNISALPTESGMSPDEIISGYKNAITEWHSGYRVADDAERLETFRRKRLRLAAEIEKNNLVRELHDSISPEEHSKDPAFAESLKSYLAADIAQNNKSSPDQDEYADFVRYKRKLRDQVFGSETAIVTPDSYAKAAQQLQEFVANRKMLDEQYDLLDIRREAALEHFDNPEFIVAIADRKDQIPVVKGKTSALWDEMLIDFDRGDLLEPDAERASTAAGEFFLSEVRSRPPKSADASDKVFSFRQLREIGLDIRHDQMALVHFARETSAEMSDRVMGMAALKNTIYSQGLLEDWLADLPPESYARLRASNSPVDTFEVARAKFVEQYDNDDPRAAASFAMLERSATYMLKRPQLAREFAKTASIDDARMLNFFSEQYMLRERAAISSQVEEAIDKSAGSPEEVAARTTISGKVRSSEGTNPGEEYALDLDDMQAKGQKVFMKAVDGHRVRLSASQEDFDADIGAVVPLAGIISPPKGTLTLSKDGDAGEMARENLEELLQRYNSKGGISLAVVKNNRGEDVLDARLPSSESLSQRMLRDGFALPTNDVAHSTRFERLAKQAEAGLRGLWREGFPEEDPSWRSESRMAALSDKDKTDRLVETVGLSLATTTNDVKWRLTNSETKLFALPIRKWSSMPTIDNEIMEVAKTNPGRLLGIYKNNQEILEELRTRKDSLSHKEKVAHDRLTLGSRAVSKALVDTGHLDLEKIEKDDHPLMSKTALAQTVDKLRKAPKAAVHGVGKVANIAGEAAREGIEEAAKHTPRFLRSMLELVDER